MITNEKLLEMILQYAEELGVTGYDIGKNTSVSDQSAYKILRGETKNPRRKNLLEIWDYLERKQLGSALDKDGNVILKIEEPKTEYKTIPQNESLDQRHIRLLYEKIDILKKEKEEIQGESLFFQTELSKLQKKYDKLKKEKD